MTIRGNIKEIRITELYMHGLYFCFWVFFCLFYLRSVFGEKKSVFLLSKKNKDYGLDRVLALVLQFKLRGDSETFSETREGNQVRYPLRTTLRYFCVFQRYQTARFL